MSGSLEVRAEILKLARVLRRDAGEVDFLEQGSAEDVRRLREQVTDMLFTAHGQTLGRMAAASKLLPVGVLALISEKAFGPLLSARMAGLIGTGRAVEVAARLPASFLAEVAADLDPRRASEVIAGIPPRQVEDVTRELVQRDEYVTMGRFVGHLSDEAIVAALGAIDDRSLLHTAFVLEHKERLEHIVDLLAEERFDGVIRAAAAEDLWAEVLDMLNHVSEQRRAQLADRAAGHDDAVLQSLVQSAQEHQMWDAVLPVARAMSEPGRRRFAALPAVQAEGVLEAIVRAAAQHELWPELLPLIELLPTEARHRVAREAAGLRLDPMALDGVATAAMEKDLLDEVLAIAQHKPDEELNRIGTVLAELFDGLDPGERDLVAERTRSAGMLGRLGPLDAVLSSA
jgi:hypothetical protein